jgi:hypothetical protein
VVLLEFSCKGRTKQVGTLETAVVTTGTIAFFAGLIAEQEARVEATRVALAAYAAREWWMPRTAHFVA